MMKKTFIILLITILIGVVLFIFIKKNMIKEEVCISFLISQKHTIEDINYDGFLNSFDWVIISNEEQRKNWEDVGYVIPAVDFSKNYLIVSRYKILKLYKKAGKSKCTGVPDGEVVFDNEKSNINFYYFYLMPNIMLSQGVG